MKQTQIGTMKIQKAVIKFQLLKFRVIHTKYKEKYKKQESNYSTAFVNMRKAIRLLAKSIVRSARQIEIAQNE